MGISIKELAVKTRTSICAVSLVLNGKAQGRISPKKQAVIKAMAEKFNYRPNIAGRTLRTEKQFSVGVAMPEPVNMYYSRLVMAIQKSLLEHGYMPLFAFWRTDDAMGYTLENLFNHSVDGIISWANHSSLSKEKLPYVVFDDFSGETSTLRIDHEFPARNSISYLQRLGHTRIAYFGVENNPRLSMLERFARKHGVSLDRIIISATTDRELIVNGVRSYFSKKKKSPVSAVVTHNDVLAFCLYYALAKQGLKVPDDISVIGFDNLEDSSVMIPPLTTYGVSAGEISEHLVSMLMENIQKGIRTPSAKVIRPDFIVRESCVEFRQSRNDAGEGKEGEVEK